MISVGQENEYFFMTLVKEYDYYKKYTLYSFWRIDSEKYV